MLTENKLISYIKGLGFDIVGFSHPMVSEKYLVRAKQQQNNKKLYPRKAEIIDYIDVSKLIPNPQLIISVGLSYYQKNQEKKGALLGYYSKSSYGLDYHQVIYKKLEQIITYLQLFQPNLQYYTSCDTKVLDDRYFAYLCGNGFYGRNTMIINEEYGSQVFYGTIVCDFKFDFKPVQLIENKCFTCNLCEINCPTKSLTNYELNYQSCLSYLTQSKKLVLPSLIGNSIYGCDLCNDICPYNTGVKETDVFVPDQGYIELISLIRMSNREYQDFFGMKSLRWLNKNIIKKNAILCLGNHLTEYQEEITEFAKEIISQNPSKLLEDAFAYILAGSESCEKI